MILIWQFRPVHRQLYQAPVKVMRSIHYGSGGSHPWLTTGTLCGSYPADDSVTESESEDELSAEVVVICSKVTSFVDGILQEQPLLSSPLDQAPAGALVLDAKHHIRVPPSLGRYLRPYQREGVQFLFQRYVLGRGVILGDDMGLGKTIQVISFLSAIMRKSGTPSDIERRRKRVSQLQDSREWRDSRKLPPPDDKWPTGLIVAPSSVVNVWTREFDKVNRRGFTSCR